MTTKLLRLLPWAGPVRYVFKDPDTGRQYAAKTKQALVQQIVAYRAANGLDPIKHLNLVLENYWAKLPENRHNVEVAPPLRRGFLTYLKGGIALIDNIWYGEENMVSQEVADRRAEQCTTCPNNVFPDKGPFVSWSDNIALHSIGDRKSKHHDALGNCEVCTCCLKAKVFYKGEFSLTPDEIKEMSKVNCWQLHNSLRGKDGKDT